MTLADKIRVGDFLDGIEAGGPGSGRHSGFGQGKPSGSSKPFGVRQGMHKVLTDAGYKFKGGGRYADNGGLHPSAWYQHPSGDHVLIRDGQNWSTHGAGLKGSSPLVTAQPIERFGQSSHGLKQALAVKHGDVAAGGPGSGRSPGFGSYVSKFADAITGHPKLGSISTPSVSPAPARSLTEKLSDPFGESSKPWKPSAPAAPKPAEGSLFQRLGNRIAEKGPTFKDAAPAVPAAPKPSFMDKVSNVVTKNPLLGEGK